jgi:CheY-like chemotaxis protein
VTDTGIGISSKYYSRIFNTFYQVDNGLSRRFEGTGLGLSISKAYVELLGGAIWLNSELGKGSTFYFTIPYEPIEIPISTNEPTANNHKILTNKPIIILIAEDDKSNSKLLENMLAEPNIKIIVAENGNEVLRICEKTANIDLVLLDLKMPFLDGFKVAKRIRKSRPDLLLIAQSAYPNEKDKAIRSGCTDFICKPYTKQELASIINKHFTN